MKGHSMNKYITNTILLVLFFIGIQTDICTPMLQSDLDDLSQQNDKLADEYTWEAYKVLPCKSPIIFAKFNRYDRLIITELHNNIVAITTVWNAETTEIETTITNYEIDPQTVQFEENNVIHVVKRLKGNLIEIRTKFNALIATLKKNPGPIEEKILNEHMAQISKAAINQDRTKIITTTPKGYFAILWGRIPACTLDEKNKTHEEKNEAPEHFLSIIHPSPQTNKTSRSCCTIQ